MKVHLMYTDRDFDPSAALPLQTDDLIQDLQLDPLLDTMGGGDKFVRDMGRTALMTGLGTPEQIRYRHEVLLDCQHNRDIVEEMYTIALEILADEKSVYRTLLFARWESTLHASGSLLELFLGHLTRLRAIADAAAGRFSSSGFLAMFDLIREELDDAWLQSTAEHLRRLRFKEGLLLSASLGETNTATDFVVRTPDPTKIGFFRRTPMRRPTHSLMIPERDMAGHQALSDLRDGALRTSSRAASEAVDHVVDFATVLLQELGFYRAALHLRDALERVGQPVCFPRVHHTGFGIWHASGLYDATLALAIGGQAIASNLQADGSPLVMITGANRGGKSTFLRSVGIATLLMRCGIFVPATSYTAELATSVHTHFRREEDEDLVSGKFDDELVRMGVVIDRVHAGGLVLSNESFSSTNEREGSQIAGEVLHALIDSKVRVVMVTHMFELADALQHSQLPVAFLRAERGEDGQRPYRIVPGAAKPTSHARDMFEKLVGSETMESVIR